MSARNLFGKLNDKLKDYAGLVKIEHTVFALPFAFTSAIIASKHHFDFKKFLLIAVAVLGARTAGMSFNRVIDAEIDSRNPRTKDRHIPTGRVKVWEGILLGIAGIVILEISAYLLNPLAFKLSPIAVLLLVTYSFTKRFTWACHIVLGITVSLAPLGAWIAITGSLNLTAVLLTIAVGSWVAGFDVIYALLDVEFDKKEGIFSLPAKFGTEKALLVSRFLHLLTVVSLIAVGFVEKLNFLYFIGMAVVGLILLKEHLIVSKRRDEKSVLFAFFNLNGYISLLVFIFTLLGIWR